ncbi:hypothetical protein A2U01_0069862, partial [Trifolium medium]|nr:hypothetical protein [Trifolium medium]
HPPPPPPLGLENTKPHQIHAFHPKNCQPKTSQQEGKTDPEPHIPNGSGHHTTTGKCTRPPKQASKRVKPHLKQGTHDHTPRSDANT